MQKQKGDGAYPDEVPGSLGHVPFSKCLVIFARTVFIGVVMQRCCKTAFFTVACVCTLCPYRLLARRLVALAGLETIDCMAQVGKLECIRLEIFTESAL